MFNGVKKPVLRVFAMVMAVVMALPMMGCAGAKKVEKTKKAFVDYSFDFFDTVSIITGYEETEEEFQATIAKVYNLMDRCHKQFNIYFRYDGVNNIQLINQVDRTTGEHTAYKVEPETWSMLMFCKDINKLTNGMTNVAMGSVLALWHKARTYGQANPEEAYLPDMDKLIEASAHTDFSKIVFDENEKSVYIPDPAQSLDVGAVAKGYAIELAAQLLIEMGKTGYCLNIGGNVRTIGTKGDGKSWGVGVENPLYDKDKDPDDAAFISILDLDGMAIATSGSYQRFYEVDGKVYHHIIHPDTLMPEDIWVSVSVISGDAGLSDGLSTALFNMSLEDGKALIESLDDVEAIWLNPAGEVFKSSGFERFERASDK